MRLNSFWSPLTRKDICTHFCPLQGLPPSFFIWPGGGGGGGGGVGGGGGGGGGGAGNAPQEKRHEVLEESSTHNKIKIKEVVLH